MAGRARRRRGRLGSPAVRPAAADVPGPAAPVGDDHPGHVRLLHRRPHPGPAPGRPGLGPVRPPPGDGPDAGRLGRRHRAADPRRERRRVALRRASAGGRRERRRLQLRRGLDQGTIRPRPRPPAAHRRDERRVRPRAAGRGRAGPVGAGAHRSAVRPAPGPRRRRVPAGAGRSGDPHREWPRPRAASPGDARAQVPHGRAAPGPVGVRLGGRRHGLPPRRGEGPARRVRAGVQRGDHAARRVRGNLRAAAGPPDGRRWPRCSPRHW